MGNIKVLTLANAQINRWIRHSIGEADFIDLTCETDLVDAMIRLKHEKFDGALVDTLIPDLAVTCYRINTLHETPLALLTRTGVEKADWRRLDARSCIPLRSNSFQLLYGINHLTRQRQKKSADKKTTVDILLIGDDPATGDAMRAAFRYYWPEAGISSLSIGQMEKKMSFQKAPDGIVLDIGRQEVAGLTLLKRLGSFWPSPVIVLTESRDETLILTAVRYGADDYLQKPMRKVELIVKTRECLKRNHIPV